jgi:hypothetical protein
LIYVAATTQVVSAAIVVERREEGHALPVQRPVYFISEVLSKTKICYYRCTFGPGLVGRPEARKKKHGPGTARPEII